MKVNTLSSDAEKYFNEGVKFYEHGDYLAALASFDKAIAIDPNNANTWYNRGNALHKDKRFTEALDSYNKAIEIDSDFNQAWGNRGWVLTNLGQYNEAIDSYDKAIALKPDYADAWYWRGDVLSILGKYSEAMDSYDKAIALKPDDTAMREGKEIALHNFTHPWEMCAECKNYFDPTMQKQEMRYQGNTIKFCSFKCRTLFIENNFKKKPISNSDRFINNKKVRVDFGEYPDPNDLRTHGDINSWTDQKYG